MKRLVFVAINLVLLMNSTGKVPAAPDLTAYKDELYLPPALSWISDDGHTRVYRITMRNGKRLLHSELPAQTPFWGYEGQYPGPTIDVPRDRSVVVIFVNALDLPTNPADPRTQWPFAIPPDVVTGGVTYFVPEKPWTVVHLHGSATRPDYDGWADNAYFPGDAAYHFYPKQERAALLWYHDHGNMITRLNVYAGLTGLYIVRDPATDAGLPSGDHELPLVLQDRDFELTPDGTKFTGRFRYQALNSNNKFTPEPAFYLVNGTVRPFKKVDRSKYRLRILNGANSRFFRLAFLSDSGPPNTKTWEVIGVDGGPLKTPVPNPKTATPTSTDPTATKEMVVLAPAERLDVLVDFSQYAAGTNVQLVHLKPPLNKPQPIMQFQVGGDAPTFGIAETVPAVLRSPRLAKPYSPADDRAPAVGPVTPVAAVGKRTFALYLKDGMQTINGLMFHDPIEEKPVFETEEIWEFLNITGDDHPIHLHLVNFEIIDRQYITVDPAVLADPKKFDADYRKWLKDTSAAKPPLPPGLALKMGSTPLPADAYEKEPKDTVRVPVQTLTRIKIKFRIHTGLYMFHCHILEHEDMEMMRPFLVVPKGMPEMSHDAGQGHSTGHAPGIETDHGHE